MSNQPALDTWTEGYLNYLQDVSRKAPGTVRDVRCTLRRVMRMMASQRPDEPLWKLSLRDYLTWLEREREAGTSPQSLAKYVSHLRGLLDYTWRSGRAQRAELTGKVTPKVLRHSFATHLMDRGVDLAVIASLMGHRSPQETGVYLHVLEHATEEAVEKLERTRQQGDAS